MRWCFKAIVRNPDIKILHGSGALGHDLRAVICATVLLAVWPHQYAQVLRK